MFLLCMYEISKVFNNLQNNIQYYIYIYMYMICIYKPNDQHFFSINFN